MAGVTESERESPRDNVPAPDIAGNAEPVGRRLGRVVKNDFDASFTSSIGDETPVKAPVAGLLRVELGRSMTFNAEQPLNMLPGIAGVPGNLIVMIDVQPAN